MVVEVLAAGEKSDATSTSGGYLVLKGPNSFFPLAWVSKRQTSVSRSTTESEVVSLAHSLYQEGLPALFLWSLMLGRDDLELVIHEDNQATILVVKKGYSPKLRHISGTHTALPPQKWDNALKLLGIRQSLPEVLEDQRTLPTKLVTKAKVAANGATVVSRYTSYRSNG